MEQFPLQKISMRMRNKKVTVNIQHALLRTDCAWTTSVMSSLALQIGKSSWCHLPLLKQDFWHGPTWCFYMQTGEMWTGWSNYEAYVEDGDGLCSEKTLLKGEQWHGKRQLKSCRKMKFCLDLRCNSSPWAWLTIARGAESTEWWSIDTPQCTHQWLSGSSVFFAPYQRYKMVKKICAKNGMI